jgi:hypothetical protein
MSRSNNERDDKSTPTPEVYFVGGRLQRDSVSARGFEVFMITTLGFWLSALFIVFRSVFQIRLEDSDLGVTATVSATLAGLALAFLTLIYQLNPKDKFLKLGLSFLTLLLLLSTVLVIASFMVYEKTFEAAPRVEVWFLSSALLAAPLLGRHFTREEVWSKFERVAYLLPFIIPFPLVGAISERKLLTGSVLLLLLAVIGLPVLMTVFVYENLVRPREETAEEKFFNSSVERWWMRLKEEEHFSDLKEKILDILRRKRDAQLKYFDEKYRDSDSLLVPREELNSHPELPNESQALINRALGELADRSQIYSDAGGYSSRTRHYYIAPTPAEVAEALGYFKRHSLVVLLVDEKPSSDHKDLWLAKELAKRFRYPRSVVGKFLLGPLTVALKDDYLKSSDPFGDISKWEVYVRRGRGGPRKALEIWEARGEARGFLSRGTMSPKLRRLLSEEVLPEGIGKRLDKPEDLDKFLSELNRMLSILKTEVTGTGSGTI